jgi:hypothetical protein
MEYITLSRGGLNDGGEGIRSQKLGSGDVLYSVIIALAHGQCTSRLKYRAVYRSTTNGIRHLNRICKCWTRTANRLLKDPVVGE